jgi:hypothetical protein
VKNPTLDSFDFDKLGVSKDKKVEEFSKVKTIQDHEKFLQSTYNSDKDEIKKYLIETGIVDLYRSTEMLIEHFIENLNLIRDRRIPEWSDKSMMDKIEYLFINDNREISDKAFIRLKYEEARNYYENYILFGQRYSLNENIKSQFEYFKEKANSPIRKEKLLFIGTTYGEEAYSSESYPQSGNKVYIDLSRKKDSELVNIAVVKLKMEEDFVSFTINKFIVMMFDYGLITEDEYNKYIYGTTDEKKIFMTRYGLSISLVARLEKDGQFDNIFIDEFNNLKGNDEFELFKKTIDDFYKFEINRYLSD